MITQKNSIVKINSFNVDGKCYITLDCDSEIQSAKLTVFDNNKASLLSTPLMIVGKRAQGDFEIKNPTLWNVYSPYLYKYTLEIETANGKEDIEWLVLEVTDSKVLVISKYALDCTPYNTSYTHITWETCTLRKWLNNDFINSAFSADEKARIPTVTVSADKNPHYHTDPGNATQDRVFLLSITEAKKYFNSDGARQCKPTDYAAAKEAYGADSNNSYCWWWLRSPGDNQPVAAPVDDLGLVLSYGCNVDQPDIAVRPAMWIDLNSLQ